MFAYRDTSKEVTRVSNRIWSICSRKGYKLPIKGGKAKTATLRAMIAETKIEGFAKEQLEMLLEDYDRLFERKMIGFYQRIGSKRMHELGYGTGKEFAEAQAKLVYGDLPEPTGALPQPPSGELAPLNPKRAAEHVRAICVFTQLSLPGKVFFTFPLTQYMLAILLKSKRDTCTL